MISLGSRPVGKAYFGSHAIKAIYKGSKLVWAAIKSTCCFASGYWKRDNTWNSNMPWRRN